MLHNRASMHKMHCFALLAACLFGSVAAAPSTGSEPKFLRTAFRSLLVTDVSKAASFKGTGHNVDAPTNNAVLKVVVPVQTGNGQTFNDVLVDTGSGILWVGKEEAYVPGSYSHDFNGDFSVGYGIGSVEGKAYTDRVTIGEATTKSQIIGAANLTDGFALVNPIDGILGLGPSGSNAGQVIGYDATPTFIESLVAEGTIDQALFGIYVNGLDAASGKQIGQGEITFGGVDKHRFRGNIHWVPQIPPVDFHWEFNVTGLKFGDVELTSEVMSARTDTGVLPFGIPFDSLFAVLDIFPGAGIVDEGLLLGNFKLPPNTRAEDLPPFSMRLGGETFDIPASKYLIPKLLYSSLGLTEGDAVYTWISSGGRGRYTLGQKWLESVYTVYDMVGHRVGLRTLFNLLV